MNKAYVEILERIVGKDYNMMCKMRQRRRRNKVLHGVDIESAPYEKRRGFSTKTTAHIHRLFENYGFSEVFGRSAVMELLELKKSGASKLLSNLLQAGVIEPVSGYGKGKYKFKYIPEKE